MCSECGCDESNEVTMIDLQSGIKQMVQPVHALHDHGHGQGHSHGHGHGHSHGHGQESHSHTLHLGQEILAKNNQLAQRNRGWLAGRKLLALNLVSSPGSGKTTLIERTLRELSSELSFVVLEGDQATTHDAERIRTAGGRVVQVNTGVGCHLDAAMVARGLEQLDPPMRAVVLIENVGNLVCPALFDLGESAKVVVMSVTEGEDKPIKYPHMFQASRVMLLNKIDLLPYLQFDVERCLSYARQVNPKLEILQVSARTGEGFADWYAWLRQQAPKG